MNVCFTDRIRGTLDTATPLRDRPEVLGNLANVRSTVLFRLSEH